MAHFATLVFAAAVIRFSIMVPDPSAPLRPPSLIEIPPYSTRIVNDTFSGGKRAGVIVIGNGATYLGVYVFDSQGNCVATDDFANVATRDDLAAEWFAAQTGVYGIAIHNPGRVLNRAELAFP